MNERHEIPIACSLSVEDMGDRLAEWRSLLSQSTARQAITTGFRLSFARDVSLASHLADLAAREIECCPFFTFDLRMANDALTLDVEVPDDARELVAELFG